MIPLVFWTVAAGQTPDTADVSDSAAQSCRSAIGQELGLTIGPVTVAGTGLWKDWIILRGRFSGYRPPAPPAPGSAAPLHVINIQYEYRCWLHHGVVRRVWTHKVAQ